MFMGNLAIAEQINQAYEDQELLKESTFRQAVLEAVEMLKNDFF